MIRPELSAGPSPEPPAALVETLGPGHCLRRQGPLGVIDGRTPVEHVMDESARRIATSGGARRLAESLTKPQGTQRRMYRVVAT